MEAMLLRVPEVSARLGMSRAKVYELMASGTLRSVRIDGCRRVRTEDLLAFVADLDERWPEHVCPRALHGAVTQVRSGAAATRAHRLHHHPDSGLSLGQSPNDGSMSDLLARVSSESRSTEPDVM